MHLHLAKPQRKTGNLDYQTKELEYCLTATAAEMAEVRLTLAQGLDAALKEKDNRRAMILRKMWMRLRDVSNEAEDAAL